MQASDAIGGKVDGMAAIFEEITKIGGDILVIFNDENAHRAFLLVDCDRAKGSTFRPAGGCQPWRPPTDDGRFCQSRECDKHALQTRDGFVTLATRPHKKPRRGATAPGSKGVAPIPRLAKTGSPDPAAEPDKLRFGEAYARTN